MLVFYDTSALMHLEKPLFGEAYISPIVFQELEGIKTSPVKDEHKKYIARRLVNDLISSDDYTMKLYNQAKIDKVIHDNPFLSNIPDHRLIAEAILVAADRKDEMFKFVTCDGAQFLLAKVFPQLNAEYIIGVEENEDEEQYVGWGKYYPTEEQMSSLYSNPEFNLFGAKINEYICIYENSKDLKDILRWNGERYCRLNYKTFKTQLGEKISPRNVQQKMLFDLLQNEEISIKLCLGRFGSGKTMLMLTHALSLIQQGKFDKIVYIRNPISVKDAGQIGYLPGTEFEKTQPYIMPLADHLTDIVLEDYLKQGIIEVTQLGFIRGRDLKNSIIFCDEAENLTKQHIQLLIGRVSQGSELWLCGDMAQTDAYIFEKNSGIKALTQGLSGNKLFGFVKLIKSERSETAALADILDTI